MQTTESTRRKPTVGEVEAAGGFSIVYVDSPWSYRNAGRGAAVNHYSTMSVEQLCALPVPRIAAEDAVLFSWATWPNLPAALEVMKAWDFEYKTLAFLWVKHREKSGKRHMGGGFWTRANTEPCLLGVRGDVRRVDASVRQLIETGPDEILDAPLEQHSAKPPEVRERIVRLMGDLPRVELFARKRVEGWEAWGNEVDSSFEMERR